MANDPVVAKTTDPAIRAVYGENAGGGDGIFGFGGAKGRGVVGVSDAHVGVEGSSGTGIAVFGSATSPGGRGVVGVSTNATGTEGSSTSGAGIWGYSTDGQGVHGETSSMVHAAVVGVNTRQDGTGAAIYGKKAGNKGHAGFFEGNVHVTGDISSQNVSVTGDMTCIGADCAEEFDVAMPESIDPGTVMVLVNDKGLAASSSAYDKRVAGVVSGAGSLRPGIVLDRQTSQEPRSPVALLGKVYCKVDAGCAPIEVGDLLTTSDTPGHAMKAADQSKAFGAVIGKAMRPLKEGRALIPILVALQ